MSKKHKRRIEDMVEDIDPEKDMPLPERLTVGQTPIVTEDHVESPETSPEPEIKASGVKQAEVVESAPWSTKVNLYRR